ncbi:MAG: hypothetical protein QXL46_03300 [Nitrososphaerales archaeon]
MNSVSFTLGVKGAYFIPPVDEQAKLYKQAEPKITPPQLHHLLK